MNEDRTIEELTDFYAQEIINASEKYLERDRQLLSKIIRQLIDQYAAKRETEKSSDGGRMAGHVT